MKEIPILMKGPMVRAILEGRKTQTRRICKERDGITVHSNGQVLARGGWLPELCCPYGVPGDRLWVKETYGPCAGGIVYSADGGTHCPDGGKWKPSIFMPRWASRITLEIEAVRVERLQDISEEDVWEEGVRKPSGYFGCPGQAQGAYRDLLESINGAESWDANPHVWVITFRRITP